jgi:hypothetical protein
MNRSLRHDNPDVLSSFHVGSFAVDGELVEQGQVQHSQLSARWLTMCREVLLEHGPSFRIDLQGPLCHLGVKLTSDGGTGLGEFYVHGQLVLSTAYFSGTSPNSDAEVQAMLIASLRGTVAVMRFASNPLPFESIQGIVDRPLVVAISWPVAVPDQMHSQVRELSLHFAGAFFSGFRS